MKLRIPIETADKMRKLASVYDVSLQRIARAALVAASKCRGINATESPTCGVGGTVIDVSGDHDQDTWRLIINWYCDRELKNVSLRINELIAEQRVKADMIKRELPKFRIER